MTDNNKKHHQLPLFKDNTILPTGKYHVSYSELSNWMDCSFRHKLKHIDKIDLDHASIHTEFGTVIHGVLENFVLTGKPITDEQTAAAVSEFEALCKALTESGFPVKDTEMKEFSANLPDMVKQVPGFLDAEFPGWTVFSAEYPLFEQISGQTNKWFKGFIDSVIKVPVKKRKGKAPGTSATKAKTKNQPPMRLSEMIAEVNPNDGSPSTFADGYEFWILDWKTTSWGWPAERKRDYQKQLQLVLYKHFFCQLFGLRLDQVRCGFVLIKRQPRKSDNARVELVPVSVGPKTEQKAIDTLHGMLNQIQSGRAVKNRYSCRFCEYQGTKHCP